MPPIKDFDEQLRYVVAEDVGRGEFGSAGNALFAADRFGEAVVVYALQRAKTSMKAAWDSNVRQFLEARGKAELIAEYDMLAATPAALEARRALLYQKLGIGGGK